MNGGCCGLSPQCVKDVARAVAVERFLEERGEVAVLVEAKRCISTVTRGAFETCGATTRRDDPPSVDLLEAYLDRRDPDWRRRAGGERPLGGAGPGPASAGAMDEATALEILGLAAGATAAEVKAAHRRLMARLHPDQGGSTYLASQINQAKDLLLGRGRR